ncbi:hypothetical protein BGW41_001082 [Actinomortierella wolfii]|nr:hypothetical protein BGW41_001082 [Actinomortierella wolfii]
MIWATNSHKLAAATMYTLFFAGQVFAPKALVPLDSITLHYLREIHAAIEAEYTYRQGRQPCLRPPVSPTQHLIPVPALLDGQFLDRGRINIQHFLQAHYIESYVYLAKRLHDVEPQLHLIEQGTVMGFDTMNEPSPGYLNHPDLNKLLDLADLKVGVCPTPFQGMLLAAGNTVVCEDWTTGQIGPLKRGSVKVNTKNACLWKRPVWPEDARHPSLPLCNDYHPHRGAQSLVVPSRLTGLNIFQPKSPQQPLNADQEEESQDADAEQGWPTPIRYSNECLWAQHGVWDPSVKILIQPHYFERIPRRPTRLGFGDGGTASTTGTMMHRATIPFEYRPGEPVEWKADFWLPFVNTMTLRIRQQDERFLMFVEPPINERPPNFRIHKELVHNMWAGITDWRAIGRRIGRLVHHHSKKGDKTKNKRRATGRTDAEQQQPPATHTVHELHRLEPPPLPLRGAQLSLEPMQRLRQQLGQVMTVGEGNIREQCNCSDKEEGDDDNQSGNYEHSQGKDHQDVPLPKEWGWCANSEQHAVFDARGDVSHNIVAAPHFYDGYTNITRDFVPFTLDYIGYKEGHYSNVLAALHFGWQSVGQVWRSQVGLISRDVHMSIGPHVAVLMGETGIPMDLHNRASYRHFYGDPKQDFAMGLLLRAMDDSRLSYMLWNYCPDNSHTWGDRWNGEDFSVWCEPENTYQAAVAQRARATRVQEERPLSQSEGTRDAAAPESARKLTLTELASELPLETTGCSEGPIWWCCVPRGIVWNRQKRRLIEEQSARSSSCSVTNGSIVNYNDKLLAKTPTPSSVLDPKLASSSEGLVQHTTLSDSSETTITTNTTTPPNTQKPLHKGSAVKDKKKKEEAKQRKKVEWQDLLPNAVRRERLRVEYRGLRCGENFIRAYPLATHGEPVFFRFDAGRTVKQHVIDPCSIVAESSITLPSSPSLITVIQNTQKQCWETRFSLVVQMPCKTADEIQARKRRGTKENGLSKDAKHEEHQKSDSDFSSTDIFLPRFHFPLDSLPGVLHFEELIAMTDSAHATAESSRHEEPSSKEGSEANQKTPPGRWHQLEIVGTDGWWAMDSERQILRYWPTEYQKLSQLGGVSSASDNNGSSSLDKDGEIDVSLTPLQQVDTAKDPTLSDMERRLVALQAIGWDEQQTPGISCTKEQEWIQQWFKARKQQQKRRRGTSNEMHGSKGKETVAIASPCRECGQAQVMHLHGLTVAVKIWHGPAPPSANKSKEEK